VISYVVVPARVPLELLCLRIAATGQLVAANKHSGFAENITRLSSRLDE
jgi:hypothetical protein